MNHNTARCSSCNTICVLPHLRARASAAKCEACARREAERVRELRSDEYAASPPQMTPPLPPRPETGWLDLKLPSGAPVRVWPGPGIALSVPRDAVVYDDKWEQRARELTEEKRRDLVAGRVEWLPEAGSIPCKCGGWITPHHKHDGASCAPKGQLAADGMGGLVDPYLANRFDVYIGYRSNLSLHEQSKSAR